MAENEEAMTILHQYRDAYLARTQARNFDRDMWEKLNILSASVDPLCRTSHATFSIVIPQQFGNHFGTMHGGAVATLFDGLTSSALALVSKPGFWDGGEISRAMQITFFRRIPLGELLRADAEVVHVGTTLASIKGVIRDGDGSPLASCLHEKFSPRGSARL